MVATRLFAKAGSSRGTTQKNHIRDMASALYLSDAYLTATLSRADREELEALVNILNPARGATASAGAQPTSAGRPGVGKNAADATQEPSPQVLELQRAICRAAGHSAFNFLRAGSGIPYCELLFDAAKSINVEGIRSPYSSAHEGQCLVHLDRHSSKAAQDISASRRLSIVHDYVATLERALLAKLMVVVYEAASERQRAIIDAKVAEFVGSAGGKGLQGLSTSAVLLAVGNLGGFTTYTLMSTVLSAVSFGTLNFGAYVFASSMLSVVLGPVGWSSLAAYGVYRLGRPDSNKVIRLAATCAMISERLREQRANPR